MKDFIPGQNDELKNEGWLLMKAMLDLHMPEKEPDQHEIIVPVKWWCKLPFRQVAVLVPFICISLLTGRQGILELGQVVINEPRTADFRENVLSSHNPVPGTLSNTTKRLPGTLSNDEKINYSNIDLSKAEKDLSEDNLVHGIPVINYIDRSTVINYKTIRIIDQKGSMSKAGKLFHQKVKAHLHISPQLPVKEQTNKEAQPKFELGAGIGYNSSGARGIYPVLAVSYHINKRSALSLGLEANVPFSPKDVSKREVSFINDTSMNIQFEVSKEKINELVYLNVPLEYAYTLSKNFSLISGVELSLLQKVHTSRNHEVYDYSSSPARVLGPAVTTNVNGLQKLEDKVEIRNTNIKINTGVSYRWGPAAVQVKYHLNIHEPILIKDFNGSLKGGNKGMFSIRLLYQL